MTDENDAARMLSALTPLHAITEAGAALLLVHHPRKSDGAEGQAARGSGAFPGFVDVILELRWFAPENHRDRRRVLTAYNQFDETVPEAVIELTETSYRCVGTKAEATGADRMAVIANGLPTEPPGLTREEVRAAWPDGRIPKPGERTMMHDLKQGAKEGRWSVTGAGAKGDPLQFWVQNSIRARSPSIAVRIESSGDGWRVFCVAAVGGGTFIREVRCRHDCQTPSSPDQANQPKRFEVLHRPMAAGRQVSLPNLRI